MFFACIAFMALRRDSPSSPPSKRAKGLAGPRNTIDKFFRWQSFLHNIWNFSTINESHLSRAFVLLGMFMSCYVLCGSYSLCRHCTQFFFFSLKSQIKIADIRMCTIWLDCYFISHTLDKELQLIKTISIFYLWQIDGNIYGSVCQRQFHCLFSVAEEKPNIYF